MAKTPQEIEQFLTDMGLTKTERVLYLTGLQVGGQNVSDLAKQAGIKRTTAYSALQSLIVKGFAGTQGQARSMGYVMEPPQVLEHRFVEEIDTLKQQHLDFINILPLFDDLARHKASPTEVARFSGFDGVKAAVDTALYCSSRTWKIIAPEHNFFSEGGKAYADYFIKIRSQRGIKAQSLWEPAFAAKRKVSVTGLEFRSPRILPPALVGRFKSTIILFDESVLFINSSREQTAVLIRSKEINDTMTVFFDGLYAAAKPVPKKYHR